MKNFVISIFLVVSFFVSPVYAQESTYSVKSQIAKVIFFGLGGAVLGLSTLSFYGEPQEHLSNISAGLAIGIIAGASYVTYESMSDSTSTSSSKYFFKDPADFEKDMRAKQNVPILWAYRWDF